MKERQWYRKPVYAVLFVICIWTVIVGMWEINKRMSAKIKWSAQTFRESSERLDNRERGFYHLARFCITDDPEQKDEWYEQIIHTSAENEMILLQINLQNYASERVSETGIKQIRTLFQAYEEKKIDLIVRFVYDWDGKALLTEPSNLEIILGHIDQMGEVLREFKDSVYIVQGVFAGNWGEMNGSRHLRDKSYLKLLKKLHEAVPETIFLAVRTPGYWRQAAERMTPLTEEEAWHPEQMISRLSLYNDGIMGNELDYGTYGEIEKKDADRFGEHWIRKDELAFQNQLNLYVPNGGEVIKNNKLNDLEPAAAALEKMHVSYLNADYDTAVLDKWKGEKYREEESVYDGMSGYDYIERHLGYRYVIRDAKVKLRGFLKKELQVDIEIENVGFSGRYTPCHTILSLCDHKSGREIYAYPIDTDVRKWKPSHTVKIKKELPVLEEGEYDMYLKITDDKRKETVWLANQEIADEDGKYLLGTVKSL